MKYKITNFRAYLVTFLGVFAYSMVGLAGGSGTGGGNYILGTQVTQSQAATELSEIKPYVTSAFNYLDIAFHGEFKNPPPEYFQTRQKLFDGKKTVFDLLKIVHVDALQSSPCHDSAGTSKAGSVYDTSPDEICLSVQTAQQQLTTDNLFPQLVGIYAHELTHKMGGNEDLAQWVQRFVLAGVSAQSKGNFNNLKDNLRAQITEELKDLAQLNQDLDKSPNWVISDDLANLQQEINLVASIMSEVANVGLSPVDRAHWMEAMVLVARATFASFYAQTRTFELNGKTTVLENKTELLPVNRILTNDPMFQNDRDQIIKVGYHDKSALRTAILQIATSAKDLSNVMQEAR